MRPLVSVIIVNWNGIKWLKQCLDSLYNQKYQNIEVIFVDNASTDRSVSFVKNHYPTVKVIVNKKNLGFAQANNIGFDKSRGDLVYFLNNDTELTENTISALVKAFEKDKNIGGAQSKIFLMKSRDQLDSAGSFMTYLGFLYHYGIFKRDSMKYSKQYDIYSAKGASMIFNREALQRVIVNKQLFDNSYFAYFEETDLCHRVWLAGYRVVYCPSSIIYHESGGTSSSFKQSYIQFHSFKNRLATYIKNFSIYYLILIIPMHIIFCELYSILVLIKGDYRMFLAINKAFFITIKNLPDHLEWRSIVQSQVRRVEDKEFMNKILRNPALYYFISLTTNPGKYVDK